MRVRLECPIDFLTSEELHSILAESSATLDTEDPEVVVVNPGTSSKIESGTYDKFKSLKNIATPSTGTSHIDIESFERKGIDVTCLLDDKESLEDIHASAEFTWIHIMNLVRNFTLSLKNVSRWREQNNESLLRSRELHGKSIGIVGLGRIGRKIAKYADVFGMKVFYYDPYVETSTIAKKVVNLSELETCDVISINCYLTKETENMITWGTFDNIKRGSVIVNTSRGDVVDDQYVSYLVTVKGVKFGADVLRGEQALERLSSSEILSLSSRNTNVVVSPHVAGATTESQTKSLRAMLRIARRSIEK